MVVRCTEEMQHRRKRIRSNNWASSSGPAAQEIIINLTDADEEEDHKDQIFLISDEKYTSFSSKKDEPSSSVPETSPSANKLEMKRQMVTIEEQSFCGICMDTKASSEMFSNEGACRHQYCSDCISQHVSVKIKENIASVKCPDPNCKEVIGPELCRSIVPKEVLKRWEDALCESKILATQKFYCPFKDCSAMLVDDGGKAMTSSECPNCHRLFCAQCKVAWHSGMECREFMSLNKDERTPEDIMLMQLAKQQRWKRCPNCQFYVEKRSGCDNILCRCGHTFWYRR